MKMRCNCSPRGEQRECAECGMLICTTCAIRAGSKYFCPNHVYLASKRRLRKGERTHRATVAGRPINPSLVAR